MTRFQVSAVFLQSHSQVSLHFAVAHTSQSVPFTSALPRAVLFQEDNTWNNSEAGVNFLTFICKWRHSVTFIFKRFTSTLNILERLSTQFCATLFYTNVILTVYLAQYQNIFFLKENQREVSNLTGNTQNTTTLKALMGSRTAALLRPGVPKWMLQLYHQLCSSSPWDPSKSRNGSQTL